MIFCLLSKKFVNYFTRLAESDAAWSQSQLELLLVWSDRSLPAHQSSRLVKHSSKASHYVFVKTINPTPTEHSQSPVIGQTVTKQIT